MVSIIICSRKNEISTLSSNIQKTVGCDYELIVVDNSDNQYSIFSAYNYGIEKSKYPYLCFVHEDVEFLTENWGNKIIDHLSVPNTGLIGVAGGQAMLRVPYGWPSYNAFCNITHSTYNGIEIVEKKEFYPISNEMTSLSVVLLDGVFLCAKKELFSQMRFDENLGDFHGYDLDISMQSIQLGYSNFVVYDVDLKHFSKGKYDINYVNTLLKIFEKWSEFLPVFERSYTGNKVIEVLSKAEKKSLLKLRKIMIRSGMKFSEIKPVLKKYVLLTGNKTEKFFLFLLPLELHFIHYTSIIRKKMNYQRTNI